MCSKKIIPLVFAAAVFFANQAESQNCVNPAESTELCGSEGKCASLELSVEVGANCSSNTKYTARDIVHLKPGFHYTPQSGKYFHAKVDKSIILPAVYPPSLTETSFDSRSINTGFNTPVGSLAGQADVNLFGAATYSIPIYSPPGTADMAPTISINYNSMSGSGVLGNGWSLSAYSVISRTARNLYNDNISGGINLDGNDRFLLDGNRLIAVTLNYGENGTVYRTESEIFSKVTSIGSNGPEKFEVITKDGKTLQYGYTSDSKLLAANNSTAILWALNEFRDQYGNKVNYKYKNDGNELRIEEISYTENANAGIQPYNKIRFYYDSCLDKNTAFINGTAINRNILLRKIEVICEGKKIKEYEFKYSYDISSFLKEVIEFGNDLAFNSTVFNYGDAARVPSAPAIQTKLNNGNADNYSWNFAEHWMLDFNGDGKVDIIQLISDVDLSVDPPNFQITWINWNLLRNDGNNSFHRVLEDQVFPTGFQALDKFYPINKNYIGNMMFTSNDINGDGLEDLVFTTVSGNDYTIHPYFSDGTTLQAQSSYTVTSATAIRFMDLDGDQRMDIFASTYVNGHYYLKAFLDGNLSTPKVDQEITTNYNFTESYPIDLDGDGRPELANILLSGTKYFAKYDNVNNQFVFYLLSQSGGFYADYKLMGDFNGDGKSDVLYANPSNPADGFNWYLNYGKGNNTFEPKTFTDRFRPPFIEAPWNGVPHYAIDMNGDGKTDIVEIGGTTAKVFLSNGMDFEETPDYTLPFSISETDDEVDFGDFDGDGAMEILVNRGMTTSAIQNVYIIDLDFKPTRRFLHGVANGINHKTKFQYSPLTAGGSFYTKSSSSLLEYPISDLQGPLYVVNSITIPDGIGETRQTEFQYEGAKIHKQGKGLLCFSKITSIDNTSGIKSEVNYSQILGISPIVAHSVCSTKTIAINGNNIISESIITNSAKTYEDKRFFPYVDYTTVVNNLKGQTISNDFSYNYDGNLITSSAVYDGAESESAIYTYVQSGSWLPNRIQTQILTKSRGDDSYEISNYYDYDPNGKLKEQRVFNGLAKEVKTEYTYNSIGNFISSKISSTGLDDRTITINEYDENGRFATKISNPLDQVTEAKYDPKWGTPLMKKGVDGLVTKYEYDAFGRLTKMRTPDNIETNYSLDWVTSEIKDPDNNILHVLYSSTASRAGSPSATAYYDIFGRVLKSQKDGLTKNINSVQTFNNKGQIKIQYAPYFDNDLPGYNTENKYYDDGLYTGLPEMVSNSVSGPTFYEYNAEAGLFTTTITRPSTQKSIQTTDASGKIVSAKDDNEAELKYSYWGHGQLKEVNLLENPGAAPQLIASMQYDAYARQSKLSDQNAGEITYTYNAFGELEHQDDASGSYNFEYDKLGRMRFKKKALDNSIETSLEYWGNGVGINQVKFVKFENETPEYEVTQQYNYDNLGRLTSATENIVGEVFTTGYTYDAYSNVSEITYPSGFKTTNLYDSKGFLISVINASGQTIWSDPKLNSFGQYTEYKNNLVTIKKDYTLLGMLSSGNANNGTIYSMGFIWDELNGNLKGRADGDQFSANFESFTYDNLNRLRTSDINSLNELQEVTYHNNGNISSKTRIGNFSYDNGQLNAVEKVGNIEGDISSFTQDITYTFFKKCSTITENNKVLTLTYGPDQQRRKSVLTYNGQEKKTIIYNGNYEKIAVKNQAGTDEIYEVHYLGGGAINVRHNNTDQIFYAYTDHLGSIVKITNASGAIVFRQNFDAWGRKRNPDDWTYDVNSFTQLPIPLETHDPKKWLIRGFTGHEHLDEFALINMNGRVYDPLLGRMLSPDNYVQDATSSQSFNRYSYALNNPLKYTDPTGELFGVDDAVAAAIGGTFNVISNWNNIENFGQGAAYFGIGAAGGVIGLYTFGAGGGAFIALGNGLMQGQDASTIGKNMVIGAVAGGVGFGIGAGIGSMAPGFDNISSNFGRYAAKAGFSFGAGFVSGFGGSFMGQMVASAAGWQNGVDFRAAAMSGLAAGGTSAAVSIGFSAYDYASWDRFDNQTKVNMLGEKFGVETNYDNSIRGNIDGVEFTPDAQTQNGVTTFSDNVLNSRSNAYATMAHEAVHAKYQNIGIYNAGETPAYRAELQYMRSTATPSRYIMQTQQVYRDNYAPNGFVFPNSYNPTNSNYFFNIWR